MNLTPKQIIQLNDKYREYTKNNPSSNKTFIQFRKEFLYELKKKDIEKAKKEYQKNGRKIRSLVKAGKVIE